MSGSLERQMREDKVLRDAALANVKADISHIKADFSAKNPASRFADRMTEGAVDVFEEAVEVADNNRGVLATLLAAVVLWFARNPIMELFNDENDLEEYPEADQDSSPDHPDAFDPIQEQHHVE